MQPRPVIGIAMQTQEPIPGQMPLCWVMGQKYVRALCMEGAIPWLIPLLRDDEANLQSIYRQIDGVYLTGGVDVDPYQYGERPHEKLGETDAARDWTELRLIRWAMRDGKPILGVCRGIQVINVAAGGTLFQDIQSFCPRSITHDYFPERDALVHNVRLTPGTQLERILGAGSIMVNSMHHQGIKALAPGLLASAWAPDDSIEGIEGTNGAYLIGVQWHPEELTPAQAEARRLFSSFVDAATLFASHR
jgi:putative glutamine amidotransferase